MCVETTRVHTARLNVDISVDTVNTIRFQSLHVHSTCIRRLENVSVTAATREECMMMFTQDEIFAFSLLLRGVGRGLDGHIKTVGVCCEQGLWLAEHD